MIRPRRSIPSAVMLTAALLAGCVSPSGEVPRENATAAVAPVEVELSPSELSQVQGISMGREDAPVVIHEFADFQCPGCAQFAQVVTPFVKERYVTPGQVRYTYYDFPLTSIHPHAFLAARAGRCANEQDKFWEYHDLLYARQGEWARIDDATAPFISYAEQLELNREEFEACLRSDRFADEVSRSLKLGEYLGVPGTPTLFVNGKRIEIRSLQDLERIVQAELGNAAAGS